MAINIFQGGKPSKGSTPKSSPSASVRARNAINALAKPSATSDSGNTAVAKSGTLSKVGNTVGKIAGIASKFLPGIGGTIAKGISNIFNDPEWWQSVPGDAVTVNAPLRLNPVKYGANAALVRRFRPAIGEFTSSYIESQTLHHTVIAPSQQMITQYLMPEIRKVINAVPLQSAQDYSQVLCANATLYAMWHELKKIDYMCKHGQTYLANMNDPLFPLYQVQNAAWLQSTIGRLEEYLRANVRLPHTLCEYIAWRYGRVYKSNNSTKAGIIMYNVVPMQSPNDPSIWDSQIANYMAVPSSTPALQAANADLYNVYIDHDIMVEVKEDTQFRYDAKEFCLRTNLDLRSTFPPSSEVEDNDAVFIDSLLDNPTTFMASTVSTMGLDMTGTPTCLFPVKEFNIFVPIDPTQRSTNYPTVRAGNYANSVAFCFQHTGSDWMSAGYNLPLTTPTANTTMTDSELLRSYAAASLLKALDVYNKEIFVTTFIDDTTQAVLVRYWDITSIDMDMGEVPASVIGNEHVYAFANLIDIRRKHSQSYREAETLVAKETANLIEKLDVASSK